MRGSSSRSRRPIVIRVPAVVVPRPLGRSTRKRQRSTRRVSLTRRHSRASRAVARRTGRRSDQRTEHAVPQGDRARQDRSPRKPSHAGKAAALFGGAAVAGWLALLMLSLAVAWLLDDEVSWTEGCHSPSSVHSGSSAALRDAAHRTYEARASARASTNQGNTQGGRGMGQSAEQLKREIEDTRGDLG